ncbi:hypothetical protein AHAS_Ahas07G0047100 [Arachis hypogaea]
MVFFSVQWTDGWSTDSTDDDEGSATRSPETEEVQSAAGDREDGSVAGDEGSMPVPTGIHVAADTEYGDEELGSAVLTAAALESAEYNSVEEAYKAYVAFAKATGFAVRKGDSVKNEEGNIVRKFFLLQSTRKWRMKTFIVDHNHDLAPPDFTNVMAPHRKLTDGDKAHIHSMHEAGFQTTQIMGFFAHLCGGYRNVNFIRKDLYNYMDDVRQSRIVEGDAAAAINYLKGKTEMDPLAVVKYSYCAEKHLGNLFWSDGHMQYDYECFGDVLAFDSTYKKNLYNRPLVIFSGTNHHRQTIMFGFGLLEDEKIPSYKWLLGCFLEVMQSKEPKVVVTDGDKSMKEAIRSEFPNATHRLCSWHLARNALQKIKDSDFCDAFKTAVYGHFDVKEFEDYWAEVVRSFGLEDNDWIASTYEKKEQWAHAYLCDKFCAGLRTTSRCEGINSSLKKFIKSGNCLLELVENLDRVVKDYRNNEFIVDYKSLYTDPVLTTGLESLERSASKLYTREIFFEVKKQIESVGGMIVLHKDRFGSTEKFMLRKFRKPHRVHAVLYDRGSDKFECSCKLWNTVGIPCGHIFCVLKELDVEELPDRLVLKRWCKDAKSDRISTIEVQSDPDRAIHVRYGALWATCSKMCFLGAQGSETYKKVVNVVAKTSNELESMCYIGNKGGQAHPAGNDIDIGNPHIIRSKGAPRGSTHVKNGRRCRRNQFPGRGEATAVAGKGAGIHSICNNANQCGVVGNEVCSILLWSFRLKMSSHGC